MFLLLSTSDTDLLSARASGADFAWGNPSRLLAEDIPAMAESAELIIVRILGSRRSWESGIDAVLATGLPVVVSENALTCVVTGAGRALEDAVFSGVLSES